jgi:hypothetical protein
MPGCGKVFSEDEKAQYVRHVGRCSTVNAEVLEEHAAMRAESAFTGVLDKEQQKWHREVQAGVRNPKSRGVIVDPVKS